MGSLYRPKLKSGELCRIYWTKIWVNGSVRRESTETDSLEEAKRILRVREGHVAEGKEPPAHAHRVMFEDLARDYLTDYKVNGKKSAERAYYSVEGLKLSFAGWKAKQIKTPAIRAHIALRQKQGCANGTINRELAALHRMFALAMEADILTQAPYVPKLKERNVRTGFFSEADYLALRETLPNFLHAPCDFAYQYGWRRGEIFSLTWDRLDLTEGTIRLEVGTTKNDDARTIKLTPEMWELLRRLRVETVALEQRTGRAIPWVFHRNGKKMGSFKRTWDTACAEVHLPGRLFHDFRRTAGRNMLRQGIDQLTIMKIMGHKTRSMFDHYQIVSQEDLDAAARKMATGMFSPLSGHVEASNPQEIHELPRA